MTPASEVQTQQPHSESEQQTLATLAHASRVSAAIRAAEQRHPHPLFLDPHAATLAGPLALAETSPQRIHQHILVRVRYIDDRLRALLSSKPDVQFVQIGCGLETRALRLSVYLRHACVFELDTKHVHELKRELLERIKAHGSIQHISAKQVAVLFSADNHDWKHALQQAGFDRDRPTVWLTDGFLSFMERSLVELILSGIGELSAPGSVLLTDILNLQNMREDEVSDDHETLYLSYLRCSIEQPVPFFSRFGFTTERVVRMGGADASFGRWKGRPSRSHFIVECRKTL
ncbi:methyltransferase [Gracilaria domingensis]|nr:methyltransferase [Gracilaria domingensis]